MTETCFRMKGTTLTSIVLEVVDFKPNEFESQLAQKLATAPHFFTRSSLILHLLKPMSDSEFTALVALCRKLQLQPMAVKGEVGELKPVINELGLADVSQSKSTDSVLKSQHNDTTSREQTQSYESEQSDSKKETPHSSADKVQIIPTRELKPAKVISRPVRSGQQVDAEGSD